MNKRKIINSILILAVVILSSCEKQDDKTNIYKEDDFQKIFSKEEYLESEQNDYEHLINLYQDSIRIMYGNIKNNIMEMKNQDDRKMFSEILAKDSIIFTRNLNSQTNMIFYSYNGYSEGINGEKSIYCNIFYLNKIKEHLYFLKGINYNLEKNTGNR